MDIKWTVKQAFKIKAKIAAVKARYEKRREKYYTLHKDITATIKAATEPLQRGLDVLEDASWIWRATLPKEQEPTLEGVEFRGIGKLKFDPEKSDIGAFINMMVFGGDAGPQSDEQFAEWMKCLTWNVKAVQARIDKLGELHGLPITAVKDRGTIVFKEKKEDAAN